MRAAASQQSRGGVVGRVVVGCGVLGLAAVAMGMMLVASLLVSLSTQRTQNASVFGWCEEGGQGAEQAGTGGEQSSGGAADRGWDPPAGAPQDAAIPEDMLALYRGAGEKYGVDWAFLAAVGYTESRHYTDPATREENHATAAGAMQFTRATWEDYGISPDGEESDDLDDRYKAGHSVYSAAYMLSEHGASSDPRAALWRYNQSEVYADSVLEMWEVYRGGELPDDDGGEGTDAEIDVVPAADLEECPELEEAGADAGGVVAAAPDELTQRVVEWALDQRGKPYIWGGTGPDGYDCSGLVMMAYQQVGVAIPRVTHDQVNASPKVREADAQPGDLIFFNTQAAGANTGPNPRHVGMVVDPERQLMVEAWCTSCGPIATRTWEGRDVHAITRPLAGA